jgi:hypothetical protein
MGSLVPGGGVELEHRDVAVGGGAFDEEAVCDLA